MIAVQGKLYWLLGVAAFLTGILDCSYQSLNLVVAMRLGNPALFIGLYNSLINFGGAIGFLLTILIGQNYVVFCGMQLFMAGSLLLTGCIMPQQKHR